MCTIYKVNNAWINWVIGGCGCSRKEGRAEAQGRTGCSRTDWRLQQRRRDAEIEPKVTIEDAPLGDVAARPC
ncbi:ABC transporter [Sesbania bispinosa]|nr:ABC transporter [Sesbania bispinosa]